MKRSVLVIIALLAFSCSYAQTFTLNGMINAPSGTVFLLPLSGDDAFYPHKCPISAPIVNNKFTFSDSITYPTAYKIGLSNGGDWQYISGVFWIDKGTQSIACDVTALKAVPAISNKSMKELTEQFNPGYNAIEQQLQLLSHRYDSLDRAFGGNIPPSYIDELNKESKHLADGLNRYVINYAHAHPGSHIMLWKLVEWLSGSYQPAFDTVYSGLSAQVKKTKTGTVLAERIDAAKRTVVGMPFPALRLPDINKNVWTVAAKQPNKYTLIDFWFSHCAPCVKQFPAYKQLYDTYRSAGFEMIGISVDRTADIGDWKKMIQEKNLNWPQFLDENAVNASKLSVHHFPYNFLLNEQGIIIRKNIDPAELGSILANMTR